MRILIAEDNQFYRCALEATIGEWGHEAVAASDGHAAWTILRHERTAPKIAILDWQMPGIDGLEVCRRLRAAPRLEPTYVIILTAQERKGNVAAALRAGADDFVTKPFDREELAARLQVGRRIVGLQTGETVIHSFALAVEGKSPYTRGHAERVAGYCDAFARRLGLSEIDRMRLRRGALLHDIGKIAVPDAILDKPGKLTAEETAVIRRHPVDGARIVERLETVRDVLPLIRWHHERLDGQGYPDGLRGEQIPPLVRILSVADVYDALRSDRPYRAGLPHARCLEILRTDAAEGGLDPTLAAAFCRMDEIAAPVRRPSSGAVRQDSAAV